MTASGTTPSVGGELLSTGVKRLLLDRIMSGYYKPGERIVELRLAKEQGISQSPIREALRDLAAIGLIDMHSRRGSSVRIPTGAELSDVSLVRSEIDALAARIATPILSEDTLDEIQQAYDEMGRCRSNGDILGLTQADARFHRIIAMASGNKAIERVFDQLEPFARTFITLTMPDIDFDVIMHEHLGILTALRDRNADLAATRARAHQLGISEIFRRFDPAAIQPEQ
jgi:DNA-binding GntR family transcriptional regulator